MPIFFFWLLLLSIDYTNGYLHLCLCFLLLLPCRYSIKYIHGYLHLSSILGQHVEIGHSIAKRNDGRPDLEIRKAFDSLEDIY